jgi:hypothetical protein
MAASIKKRAYQVFVSHATADKWIATAFCEKIRSAGASFFRDDHEIKAGDQNFGKPSDARTNS